VSIWGTASPRQRRTEPTTTTPGVEFRSAIPRHSLFSILLLSSVIWVLFASAPSLAAITLTESSIRSTLVVNTKRPNTDILTLSSGFRLGAGETADPAKESVTLRVEAFSQTLPPGSFKKRDSANRTTWTFRGPRNGLKHVEITRSG
jgi:hypothetical protein